MISFRLLKVSKQWRGDGIISGDPKPSNLSLNNRSQCCFYLRITRGCLKIKLWCLDLSLGYYNRMFCWSLKWCKGQGSASFHTRRIPPWAATSDLLVLPTQKSSGIFYNLLIWDCQSVFERGRWKQQLVGRAKCSMRCIVWWNNKLIEKSQVKEGWFNILKLVSVIHHINNINKNCMITSIDAEKILTNFSICLW